MKNIIFFSSILQLRKIAYGRVSVMFTAVKNRYILNGHDFVMSEGAWSDHNNLLLISSTI